MVVRTSRRAPPAHDHRGAQRRNRHRSGGEAPPSCAGFEDEVTRWGRRRRVGRDDDLLHPRQLARSRDILRGYSILPLEVTPAKRVDKVVDDLCALDGSGDVMAEFASPSTQRTPCPVACVERGTATSSWSATRSGRSALPTAPVAPKTVTFTRLPSTRVARSNGDWRERATGSVPRAVRPLSRSLIRVNSPTPRCEVDDFVGRLGEGCTRLRGRRR
jgi:hypothetical protein